MCVWGGALSGSPRNFCFPPSPSQRASSSSQSLPPGELQRGRPREGAGRETCHAPIPRPSVPCGRQMQVSHQQASQWLH